MKNRTKEQILLLEQLKQISDGLAQTFAPFCEVVVHDLLDPEHSLLAIHNNLSGREVGQSTTEIGRARVSDSSFDQIIANYPNQFADGRQAKSTSIGIKDSSGRYIAALCMNVDLTMFHGFQSVMNRFVATTSEAAPKETLAPSGSAALLAHIDSFAARLATAPRALTTPDRKALLRELKELGLLDVRRAMEITAEHLGVSRAAVYNYIK